MPSLEKTEKKRVTAGGKVGRTHEVTAQAWELGQSGKTKGLSLPGLVGKTGLWGQVTVLKGLRNLVSGASGWGQTQAGSDTHNSEGMAQGCPSAVMVRLRGTGVGGGAFICCCILYNSDSCCSSLSVDSWAPMGVCWIQGWPASLLCPLYPGWNPGMAAESQS